MIAAGAVLGFAAGLIQQGLETGAIKIPDVWSPVCKKLKLGVIWSSAKNRVRKLTAKVRVRSWETPNGSTDKSVIKVQGSATGKIISNDTAGDTDKLERADDDQNSQPQP